MSARMPTPEQARAIASTGCNVMVEAGAGTGKTGVMVDRYCQLVCEHCVSLDGVLAITFTDKAATELRQRIRAALELRATAGSARAGKLLSGFGAAWVTTIHGFCNRLLAAHPVAVGIDPRFRVLDAAEAERAAREAFDQAVEEFLAAGEAAREATVATFDLAGLRSIVCGAYAELRSRGFANPRLPDPPPADGGALRRANEVAAIALEELKPANSSRELVEQALALFGDREREPSLDQLVALRTDSKAKPMAAYREAIEAAVRAKAEAGEGGVAYGHIGELLKLFGARFGATKVRRGALDFEDLQILAVHLLERTESGTAFRRRFSHLMVDEFQDTNRLQLRLIGALRNPQSKLMVVGDELQSIYGFRHADLEVFREQREVIAAGADDEVVALSGNFRSRPEVIGAVNAIGTALLGEDFRPLRVGASPVQPVPTGNGTAVELLLTGRDGWDAEGIELEPATDARTPLNQLAEARFVAARLAELAASGVKRGEMVVLLRAFTHLDAYEDSLERAGLRPYVVGGRGYWSQQQVADVCALLATIANPLDDRALLGSLASPACGVSPDTLWLLRAAVGGGRHLWPAVEHSRGAHQVELAEPERLEQIPIAERALLGRFATRISALRERANLLPLAELIDVAITETGYDLAVLMRPAGEARFANLRKLMSLAAEFEAGEGRDLRGLLDFLAARADADADAQASTAIEGHDGVRIMTIHNTKGLEFGVVAVPQLSRSLLAGSWTPTLTLGHEPDEPRVGMQLRRLGAASINLYAHEELRAEGQRRDAEEELRLFHVAATRARDRLILSGVVKPQPGRENGTGTAVIERIVEAFGIDREQDASIAVPAAEPREGLDAIFEPSQIDVRVSLPSPQRAAELRAVHKGGDAGPELGEGPAPLLERRSVTAPRRPLSYTALSRYEEIAEPQVGTTDPEHEGGTARGIAVHGLLEWSQGKEWCEPPAELIQRFAVAAGLDSDTERSLLNPIRAWLASDLFTERVQTAARTRTEVPLLLNLGGTVLRGSIDLLVENPGEVPLIVDYKTNRLNGDEPSKRVARYDTQRDIYALAASEALGAEAVEIAYVFLERAEQPAIGIMGAAELEQARQRLEASIEAVGAVTQGPSEPIEVTSTPSDRV